MSDEDRTLATPVGALDASDRQKLVRELTDFCKEHEVTRILLGLPRHMTGQLAEKAPIILDLAKRLADATLLDVELLDERLSTVEAQRKLSIGTARGNQRPQNRNKKGTSIDAASAAVMLQSWLDRSVKPRTR